MRRFVPAGRLALLVLVFAACASPAAQGPESASEVAVGPSDAAADGAADIADGAPLAGPDGGADTGKASDSLSDGPPAADNPALTDGEAGPDAAPVADEAAADAPTPADADAATPGTDATSGETTVAPCTCGDGVCDGDCGETSETCPSDCKGCGNGTCDPGEGPKTCKVDCCGACGDGKCKGYDCGESPEACPVDCGTACGNKLCDKGETPATCAEDCKFQACGNGVCEPSDGGPDGCPQDCAASCGDGTCNKGEDFLACPVDCGYCGDGFCVAGLLEDSVSCPADCKMGECNPDLASDVTKCDDQNPCTIDQCAPSGVCHHPPASGGACDDGSACTFGDHCSFSACLHTNLLDCDDGNPCTADKCDPLSGCFHAAQTGACDDKNPCTVADVCSDSACVGGSALDCEDGNACTLNACDPASGCTATDVDGGCTDGNPCTVSDSCAAGTCIGGSPLDCDDGNPCTTDACSVDSGCTHKAGIGACEDGNACTTNDACVGGVCTAGKFLACSDDNPCTADSCDPKTGCTHKAAGGACDDGNACTIGDGCKAGACVGGAVLSCDDGNPCTSDGCDATGGCSSVAADGAACSDGDICTGGDACQGGSCVGGTGLGCDDGNPCTVDGCSGASGCTHKAIDGACEDGNSCTTGDVCMNAVCTPGSGIDCSDGNPCTVDQCDAAGGCHHTAGKGACDDGNACTLGDVCKAGQCVGGAALECDDGNICTNDSCVPTQGCTSSAADGPACSDGDVCTLNDQCLGGVCAPGAVLACDDGNPCTLDACKALAGCTHKATSGSCSDDNACTQGDVCNNAFCTPGAPVDCGDGNPCTTDYCDGKLGCQHGAAPGACTDGNACTLGDVCSGGVCQAGAAPDCNDGNPCTDDPCNALSGCVHLANEATCTDQNACTAGDGCMGGSCMSGPQQICHDNNPCTVDSCNPATGCVFTPIAGPCNDGNVCTTIDACLGGVCVGSGSLGCEDGNPCTAGTCLPGSGCVQNPDDTATCDDGNACTLSDHCAGGTCQYTTMLGCDDGKPCTDDLCATATGCVHTPRDDGSPCDDGNACSTGDNCQAGACLSTGGLNCDDGNPCTTATCEPGTGCAQLADDSAPCSDGNACTTGDHCASGSCAMSGLVDCNDQIPCTLDICNPQNGQCSHPGGGTLTGIACSDGKVCTVGDLCDSTGACVGGAAANCDDGNPCSDDPCSEPTGCSHTPNSAACNDGNACTVGDACNAAMCVGTPKSCDDGQFCTSDGCSPATGGCVNNGSVFQGVACNDGNFCTLSDVCTGGACLGSGTPACDDGNQCTTDSCPDVLGCKHTARTGSCDDGNKCTTGDACSGGVCGGTGVVQCNDNNPCTSDACDLATGKCVFDTTALNGTTCSDGNFCTQSDSCSAGTCVGSNPIACTAIDQCHTAGTCAAATGACSTPNKADGTSCDDGDACTLGDRCAAGKCAGPTAQNCDDGIACTADSCSAQTGCAHNGPAMNGIACNDGNGCTTTDYCNGGACIGTNPVTCTAIDACHTAGVCGSTTGSCSNPSKVNGTACSDGNVCTTGDNCVAGACTPVGTKNCDDGLPCTSDGCDAVLDCQHAPNTGNACSDGNVCTLGDTCAAGVCVGGALDACNDGNVCTTDACTVGMGCTHVNNSVSCEDGDLCTLNDYCGGGSCRSGTTKPCTDNSVCTVGDYCLAGNCLPGAAISCDDGNACTVDSCDAQKGCQYGDNGGAVCGDFGTCGGGQCACPGGLAIQGAHCPPVLTGISVAGTTLSPTFSSAVAGYSGTVQLVSSNPNLTVLAPAGVSVTLSINGGPVAQLSVGLASATPLRLGINTLTLTAIANGMTRSYVVSLTRLPTVQQAYVKQSAATPLPGSMLDPPFQPNFGSALALSGATLAVGSPNYPGNGKAAGGNVNTYRRSGSTWAVDATVDYYFECDQGRYGQSLGLDGDTLVIGAPLTTSTATSVTSAYCESSYLASSGTVLVYVRSGGTWTRMALLKASNANKQDKFGTAVAVSGTTLVVGAPGESSSGTGTSGDPLDNSAAGSGAAYVFVLQNGTWVQQAYLKASNTEAGDAFGSAVAISGDTIVIGAPGEDNKAGGIGGNQTNNSATDSGAAYVFVRSGGVWTQQAYVKASNPDAADHFGTALSMASDSIVVGAPGEDGNGTSAQDNSKIDAGAAYVFARSGGVWSQQAYLKAASPDAADLYGQSVDIAGDALVVGAPGESSGAAGVGGDQTDNSQPNAGAAYQYVRQSGNWTLSAYLKASNPDADDAFGSAVAIDGSTVASGAPTERSNAVGINGNQLDNSLPGTGATYVFSGDTCFFGQASECDDANPCTTDSCLTSQFCSHTALATGTTCGVVGTCQSQACNCPTGWVLIDNVCRPELTGLTTSVGTPSPAFVSGHHAYSLTTVFNPSPTSTTITATTAAVGVSLSVSVGGGASVALQNGVASPALPLSYGSNMVTVTASASGVSSSYDVRIDRSIAAQDAYIKTYYPAANDFFGLAVALDNDTLAVGLPQLYGGNGAVWVYLRQPAGGWQLQATLSAPSGDSGDYFGYAVAVSGDTVVVGAQNEDSCATGIGGNAADNSCANAGAAYVFVRSGTSWSFQAYLKASNTAASQLFGSAVTVSGDTAVIAASDESGVASYSGSAYVFTRSGTTWTQQAYLKASNAGQYDRFGKSIAISGNTIVVGAYGEGSAATGVNGDQTDNSKNQSGAAYVFLRSGTAWSQQAYLKASNTDTSDSFGWSVAISADTVVVGALGEASNATGVNGNQADNSKYSAGAAYVFTRSGTTWSQQAYLKASNTDSNDGFARVAISGDRIIVGAAGEGSRATGVNGDQTDNKAYSAGAAYVFARSGTTWTQTAYLKASNAEIQDNFGIACTISGYRAVCGAYEESSATGGDPTDNSASGAGAAYAFSLAGP